MNNRAELLNFRTGDELAAAAASAWLKHLLASPSGKKNLVALSGGRIAKSFFVQSAAVLAEAPRNKRDSIQFFWADERCVGPESSESNFRLAQENLFQPLQIASAQIHRIRGELPPPEAARKAGEELRRFFSRQDEPILDLIFLGMGEDGHVASLFPEEPEAMASDPGIFRAVTASKPPPNRVTLGYSMIFRAREVWVLVSGDAKQAALKTSLAENGKTPLARVIQARAHTKIFSDVAV